MLGYVKKIVDIFLITFGLEVVLMLLQSAARLTGLDTAGAADLKARNIIVR